MAMRMLSTTLLLTGVIALALLATGQMKLIENKMGVFEKRSQVSDQAPITRAKLASADQTIAGYALDVYSAASGSPTTTVAAVQTAMRSDPQAQPSASLGSGGVQVLAVNGGQVIELCIERYDSFRCGEAIIAQRKILLSSGSSLRLAQVAARNQLYATAGS
jgi:hypothetical protein